MPNLMNIKRLKMHAPATYQIRVVGLLNDSWSDRLEGMTISAIENPDGGSETMLMGRLADQAALSGVLNSLYELHMPVLSMKCLDCN
jgi:hypothetical protein